MPSQPLMPADQQGAPVADQVQAHAQPAVLDQVQVLQQPAVLDQDLSCCRSSWCWPASNRRCRSTRTLMPSQPLLCRPTSCRRWPTMRRRTAAGGARDQDSHVVAAGWCPPIEKPAALDQVQALQAAGGARQVQALQQPVVADHVGGRAAGGARPGLHVVAAAGAADQQPAVLDQVQALQQPVAADHVSASRAGGARPGLSCRRRAGARRSAAGGCRDQAQALQQPVVVADHVQAHALPAVLDQDSSCRRSSWCSPISGQWCSTRCRRCSSRRCSRPGARGARSRRRSTRTRRHVAAAGAGRPASRRWPTRHGRARNRRCSTRTRVPSQPLVPADQQPAVAGQVQALQQPGGARPGRACRRNR